MLPPPRLPGTHPPVRALFPHTTFRHTTRLPPLPHPGPRPALPPSTEDLLPPLTAAWRGSRPRQGELLLSLPRVHHFSFGNVPVLAAGNPASKYRLCSHLLRNLVKLSTLLSPYDSGCPQYCLLCSVRTRGSRRVTEGAAALLPSWPPSVTLRCTRYGLCVDLH